MKEIKGYAVFPLSKEYHAAKETSFTYHSSTHGKVKGVSLNSLCGAYIGLAPYQGGLYPSGQPRTRLYTEAPAGFDFCKSCERLMIKRSGLSLFLSHLYRRLGSFRATTKLLYRRT
jgi:hypothetical protein